MDKRPVVAALLVLLLGALVGLAVLRNVGDGAPVGVVFSDLVERARAVRGETELQRDAGASAQTDAGSPASDAGPAFDGPRLLERPLRVVSLGWSTMAPGLLANDGLDAQDPPAPTSSSAFSQAGLAVSFRAAASRADVERALALGGGDPGGADVALIPLPTFVASYERMRALKPEAFFLIGWSQGREGIAGNADSSLTDRPHPAARPRLRGELGKPEAFVALFALDLVGYDPAHIEFIAADDATAGTAPFAAIDATHKKLDDGATKRRMLLTTGDAPRLVPYVAVAPQAFLQHHEDALVTFAETWLKGMEDLERDVPAAARRLAKEPGAPEAVALLDHLGWIELASLPGNARAAALSGRDAVTMDELFHEAWRLWRSAGLLTTPSPEAAPINGAVITALVQRVSEPGADRPPAAKKPEDVDTVLAVHRFARKPSNDDLAGRLSLLARVFARSKVQVSLKGSPRTSRSVAQTVVERFNLPTARVTSGGPTQGSAAVVRVFAAP